MKLSDLETGMVIEMRYGNKYLVVNDYFIANANHMPFSKYNEDMTCISSSRDLDIMKVWTQKEMCNLNSMLMTDWLDEDRFGNLIYDRSKEEVTVDMTLEEICKALGKNVRIVKE